MSNKQASRITPRSEDYSRWYQDVIRQGDLAEPAEVVKGSMVIKPHGFAVWEKIQRALDDMFKATGHQNAYFPLLIPQSFITFAVFDGLLLTDELLDKQNIGGTLPELIQQTDAKIRTFLPKLYPE